MYALVDVNNFYASCERVLAPHSGPSGRTARDGRTTASLCAKIQHSVWKRCCQTSVDQWGTTAMVILASVQDYYGKPTMIPLQEVTFHLSSQEVFFCQLIQIGGPDFAATLSMPSPISAIPVHKYYTWVPCPTKADAAAAFTEAYRRVTAYATYHGASVTKVNNPNNCEFLTTGAEQSIVGADIQVVINEAI